MARSTRRQRDSESNYWIGYTDLLSNSLLILLLAVSLTALDRAKNEKPPFVPLTERDSFRFATGSYVLSTEFIKALQRRLPEVKTTIDKYNIDIVEVVGHTDGEPSSGVSNLDTLLAKRSHSMSLSGFHPGSNVDLGLLRALAVSDYLRKNLDPDGSKGLVIRPYSAGSLINLDGHLLPADTGNQPDRRRIEIRFTRH
jgi:outer membrane protein OmpA-like peptidoglycan-associated protein